MSTDMADVLANVKRKMQADTFRAMTWTDQHGRRWGGQTQINGVDTLHPSTPISPVGWAPPSLFLVPLQEDMRFTAAVGEVVIDYDAWYSRQMDAHRQYDALLHTEAKRLFPNNPGEAIAERNPTLYAMVGAPPMHIDFIRAMIAGNPWVLGIRKPDGTPYQPPAKLVPHMASLGRIETHGGTVDRAGLQVDRSEFASPDEDEADTITVEADEEFGEVVQPSRTRARRDRPRPTA